MSPHVAATALPQNTGSGYVAAAYIVFFAIVLVYVAIMAVRLGRVERDLRRLQPPREPIEPSRAREDGGHESAARDGLHAREQRVRDHVREREPV